MVWRACANFKPMSRLRFTGASGHSHRSRRSEQDQNLLSSLPSSSPLPHMVLALPPTAACISSVLNPLSSGILCHGGGRQNAREEVQHRIINGYPL
ncbi:unnamed protein product [Linum trigynum]|uniref:Uncharacterized protein n=1 Tax=Linum trigynum TaxID=586398 RepID=A0AAV2G7X5_9ROSI